MKRAAQWGLTARTDSRDTRSHHGAMHREYKFWVYIMASLSGTLYTGMTNDLDRRVYEHKHKLVPGFTARYDCNRLVFFEQYRYVNSAIAREKQIKAGSRAAKIQLIESQNPRWADLAAHWEWEYDFPKAKA